MIGEGRHMRRLFRTDETYYAIIFVLFLMVQSGLIVLGVWLAAYLFNLDLGITPSYIVH